MSATTETPKNETEYEDPFEIPEETKEEAGAAVEAGMPEPEPDESSASEPEVDKETQAEVADAAEKASKPETDEDASWETKQRGLLNEITQLRDKRSTDRGSHETEVANLQAEIESLRKGITGKSSEDPFSEDQPISPETGFEIKPDDDGRLVIPNEALLQAVQKAATPTPEQRATQEAQQRFEEEEAAFIAEDPEINGRASTRVREAASALNQYSEAISLRTQTNPRTFNDWMTLFKETGADKEFQAHFPDVGELEPFMSAVFDPNTYSLRHYWMPQYIERNRADLGGKQDSSAAETPSKAAPVAIPSNRPRSIVNQGEGNTAAGTQDMKTEYDAIMSNVRDDPFNVSSQILERQDELEKLLVKAGELG